MNGVEILTADGFKSFVRIDRKIANTYVISFDDGSEIVCSEDHRFIDGDRTINAYDLELYDKIGDKTIIDIEDGGEQEVFTPVEVDGHTYLSEGLNNHNCSFLGSTSTLLDGQTLDSLVPFDPIRVDYNGDFSVYEDPEPGALYVMGVDCAMGVAGDYSTIQILRIKSKDEIYQAGCYNNNTIRPEQFADIVNALSIHYNNAQMIVENNDCGRELVNRLWYDLENPNIISTDKRGLGTKATHDTKLEACTLLKRLCETHKLEVHDMLTIQQLGRFEEVSPHVFKGSKGSHDDMVSSLYWAVYCLNQPEIDIDSLSIRKTVNFNGGYQKPLVLVNDEMSSDDFWSDFN